VHLDVFDQPGEKHLFQQPVKISANNSREVIPFNDDRYQCYPDKSSFGYRAKSRKTTGQVKGDRRKKI
jgi:hypothetical protein